MTIIIRNRCYVGLLPLRHYFSAHGPSISVDNQQQPTCTSFLIEHLPPVCAALIITHLNAELNPIRHLLELVGATIISTLAG